MISAKHKFGDNILESSQTNSETPSRNPGDQQILHKGPVI